MPGDFDHRLPRHTIVIAGASRGFGAALARAAGGAGAHVIALARTQAGLEDVDDAIRSAGGPAATLIPVDLRDHEALMRLGPALGDRFGAIDTMVHVAAAHHGLSRLWDTKPAEFDNALFTNAALAHRLIHTLHPLLVKSPRPQAIFMGDATPPSPPANWAHYAAGKAALTSIAAAYAAEAPDIHVTLFDPGPMKTALRGRSFPGADPANPMAADVPAQWLVDRIMPTRTEGRGDTNAAQQQPGRLNTLAYQDLEDA